MIEGRELSSGGTIADRIPSRPEPGDITEKLQQVIEDWDIVMETYIDEKEETPTYMQMYAMEGAIVLVKEFQASLNDLSDFLKAGGGVEAPDTQKPEATQEQTPKIPHKETPGQAEVGTASPSETKDTKTAPSDIVYYMCRADHRIDKKSAEALNFICPKCRMKLREVTYENDQRDRGSETRFIR